MDDFNIYIKMLEIVCKKYNIDMNKKIKDLSKKELDIILNGTEEKIEFNFSTRSGNKYNKIEKYEGISNNLERRYMETTSEFIRMWLESYMTELTCEVCHGARLKESSLNIFVNNLPISEVSNTNDVLETPFEYEYITYNKALKNNQKNK